MQKIPKTVVSLGMSCQATHQLARYAKDNENLYTHTKTPFDWIICSPNSLVSWLESDLGNFDFGDIIVERDRAYWPRHGMWFWHWFYSHDGDRRILDIESNFDREVEKLENLRDRFSQCDPANTTFVFSNAQNNLEGEVFGKSESSFYVLDTAKMTMVELALKDGYVDFNPDGALF